MKYVTAADGLYEKLRSRWPEWTTISIFAAVVAYAIPYHEPWVDEAQAWQLARSLSISGLFQTYIRYEGTPGLWHFLLWILNRAHVSYTGMHWICGAIAVVSTSLLVLNSPFPRYLKLTLPFTFFLVFQYAVVARSYVLVPLLLFVIASWWKKSPVIVAITLGLLANCALHAAIMSGALVIVYFAEQLRNGRAKGPARLRRFLLAALIILSFFTFALWTAWPSGDMAVHISSVRSQKPAFITSAVVSLVAPICQPWILSILFWIAIGLTLFARRRLFYLLPVFLFAVFCGAVYTALWHYGLLVPSTICLLWITWPPLEPKALRIEIVGKIAMIYMVGVQILWSGSAIYFDHYYAYSPDLAAAQFLKPYVNGGTEIAVTYLDKSPDHVAIAIGILPYFDRNIFVNQPFQFYWWSNKNPTNELFNAILPSHPSIILAEMQQARVGRPFDRFSQPVDLRQPRAELLIKYGYRITNVFCGTLPVSMYSSLTNCHVIFRYAGTAP